MTRKERINHRPYAIRLIYSLLQDRRFYQFCLVGSLGLVVNLIALKLLLSGLHLEATASSVVASLVAMTHNFILNDNITWKECKKPVMWRRMLQFPQFVIVSALGIAITAIFARLFVALGWSIYLGQLAGIGVATLWNFTANKKWTWSNVKPQTGEK